MNQKRYHHGDLRNTLIETGIELINEEGAGGFSLRKVAARCGVSHAAPYSHFKDVQQLMAAMADHVTEQFTFCLQASIEGQEDPMSAMGELGTAYIAFLSSTRLICRFCSFSQASRFKRTVEMRMFRLTRRLRYSDDSLPAIPQSGASA